MEGNKEQRSQPGRVRGVGKKALFLFQSQPPVTSVPVADREREVRYRVVSDPLPLPTNNLFADAAIFA